MVCLHCTKVFNRIKNNQKFCKVNCRSLYWWYKHSQDTEWRKIQNERAVQRQHTEAYKLVKNKREQSKKEFIIRAKSKPCADCGIQYNPWIMQFDHKDPFMKKFNLGQTYDRSISTIQEEIEKCEVVCGNCHLDRSYKKKHYLLRKS